MPFDMLCQECRPESQNFIFKWQQRPYPSQFPTIKCWVHIRLATEDIKLTNIDFGESI